MLSCHLAEESRRKNQFSKDERLQLLNIMEQYAPLLDDKSASLFGRREIWRAIERDFHQAGFTGKTSAQLKKYWQNYKYHGRRAQTGARKCSKPAPKEATETKTPHSIVSENRDNNLQTKIAEESVAPPRPGVSPWNVESGCRQRQIYGDNGTFFRKLNATPILPTDSEARGKNRCDSVIPQRKRLSSKVYEESRSSGVIDSNPEKPIGTEVIVSNTDVSDNSVTVSVICPERSPMLFSKNQLKRKREYDAPLDRSSLPSSVPVASAASPGKKSKDDEHSIFPAASDATRGRCFLLQPRQTDNRGEAISDRRNAVETRRKLDPPPGSESAVFPSTFALHGETSRRETTRWSLPVASESKEHQHSQQQAAAAVSCAQDVQEAARDKGRSVESIARDIAASRSQRRDLDEVANDDATRSRISAGNAGLWDPSASDLVQSKLRDELNYRLVLHRLETEEKRLKVKIAEMAIQEIRFRIRALNEDIRRADELHELHLALATAQVDAEGLYT